MDISNLSGMRVNPSHYWRDEENWDEGGSFSYGHIDALAKDGTWIVPNLTSGSDYSGSLVERSNFNVLKEAAENYPGSALAPAFWVELYGGHGTFALAFHIERTPEEIREMLLALEDYPLADEEAHSELEMQAQDDAWENWARSDYRRALEKEYRGDASEVSDDALFEHFMSAMDKSNTYWENEQGDSMYVDLDRVIERGAREMDPPAGFIPEEN
jgi:hypothetical protein